MPVMFLFQPIPPPLLEAEAIFEIGLLFAHLLILLLMIFLMIYSYKNIKDFLPCLIVFGFSLIIGMESFSHAHTPFSPTLEIFFLIFQTGMMTLSSLDFYEGKKGKKNA